MPFSVINIDAKWFEISAFSPCVCVPKKGGPFIEKCLIFLGGGEEHTHANVMQETKKNDHIVMNPGHPAPDFMVHLQADMMKTFQQRRFIRLKSTLLPSRIVILSYQNEQLFISRPSCHSGTCVSSNQNFKIIARHTLLQRKTAL